MAVGSRLSASALGAIEIGSAGGGAANTITIDSGSSLTGAGTVQHATVDNGKIDARTGPRAQGVFLAGRFRLWLARPDTEGEMTTVSRLRTESQYSGEECQLRVDLAAAFRLAVENDWHEGIANHFSVAVSGDGRRFLMNPKWRHFSRIRASSLVLLDADHPAAMHGEGAPDASAWCIHSRLHALRPQARCVLHVHSRYATALACLADPGIKPVDQNTARYFNRVAIDLGYGGIADKLDEGERIAGCLGDHRRLLLGNHGVIVVAATVAEAFDDLYYLERACRTLVTAYSTRQELNVMPDALAERTAREWEAYRDAPFAHFEEAKKLQDARDPSYAQ